MSCSLKPKQSQDKRFNVIISALLGDVRRLSEEANPLVCTHKGYTRVVTRVIQSATTASHGGLRG